MTGIARKRTVVLVLIVLLVAAVALGLLNGAMQLDFTANADLAKIVLFDIRMPRVLMAIGAGAALSVSGVVLQSIFRNPLADSSVTGVAAGATCGAALAIVVLVPMFGETFGPYIPAAASFAGALLTSLAVLRIGNIGRGVNPTTVILAGLVMNSLATAVTGLCTIVATDAQVRNLSFWLLGGLAGVPFNVSVILLVILTIGVLVFIVKSPVYDVLAFGHIDAQQRGVNVKRVVLASVVGVSLIVGLVVAWCGMIAFVGIIVPHIMRMLLGARHRWLTIASAIGGALLVVAADTLCRLLFEPMDVPVGIATSILGAPFFLFVLLRRKMSLGVA